jgi:O-antigen/teichoic acid export membrane protein
MNDNRFISNLRSSAFIGGECFFRNLVGRHGRLFPDPMPAVSIGDGMKEFVEGVEIQVRGVSLGRNALHGLVGFLAPAVVVLGSYPVLIRHLGAAAFGVYVLAMSISGAMMMLLDFGFSAATLKLVAEDLAAGRPRAAADVIVTSLALYGALGAVGGAGVAALAPRLVAWFQIDARLAGEAVLVFRMAGLHLVALLPVTVFVLIAKAMQQFDRSAMFVSLLSIATYGGAVLAVLAGAGLTGALAAAVAANVVALAVIAWDGLRLCRARGLVLSQAHPVVFHRMLAFAWALAANSAAGFLLYQAQRYVVGMALGPAAVAAYHIAAAVPSKLHAAVNAACEAMFPFSSAGQDRAVLRRVYLRMLGGSALVALAGYFALVVMARPLLALWLGPRLAAPVAPLVPVFALAYVFLALSPAPFHLVNGIGRPALNTVFYVINAVLNVALIAVFARSGLTLAKVAWAFAAASIFTGIFYQAAVETLIWRREPRLAEVPV